MFKYVKRLQYPINIKKKDLRIAKYLVTQYGGANSHMAIRCAELGIPAVIGAGEKSFEEWYANQSKYHRHDKEVIADV